MIKAKRKSRRGVMVRKVKSKKPSGGATGEKQPESGAALGYNPDKEWFKSQSKLVGISQRSLAKTVGLDPSALNRSLRGARKFQMHEAALMARALGVPICEVIAKIGFADARQVVKIVGRIQGDNSVAFVEGLGEAVSPIDAHLETRAYVFDTLLSPVAHLDGYIAYAEPHRDITPGDIGRPAIISAADRNHPVFAIIVRSNRKGSYHVKLIGQGVTFETNSITSVELITWMRAP